MAMSYPTPHPIQIRRHSLGAPNAHGYRQAVYGDPETVYVSGIAPTETADAAVAGRDALSSDLTVYGNQGLHVGPLDIVIINGVEYTPEGESRSWAHGPWDHPFAGVVVSLNRKEG